MEKLVVEFIGTLWLVLGSPDCWSHYRRICL